MNRIERDFKYWLFPKRPTFIWNLFSYLVLFLSFCFSKLMKGWFNTYKIHNRETLLESVYKRDKNRGLVTISNHDSCIDDPLLWGSLKWKTAFKTRDLRWILGAHDVCFTKYWHSLFFSLGQVVPVCRGDGIYQRSMDFIMEKLNDGGWTHIFPEGKINLNKEFIRFKWGVGRLIAEAKSYPIVLPMYHIGMDDILPNKTPYIPRIRKKVTLLIGQPMEFSEDLELMRIMKKTPAEVRIYITDKIQQEMQRLKEKAERLHVESFKEKL